MRPNGQGSDECRKIEEQQSAGADGAKMRDEYRDIKRTVIIVIKAQLRCPGRPAIRGTLLQDEVSTRGGSAEAVQLHTHTHTHTHTHIHTHIADEPAYWGRI